MHPHRSAQISNQQLSSDGTDADLEPADVCVDAEGVPISRRYGDVYHSRDGALAQARAVFLAGCRVPQAWEEAQQRGAAAWTVLETGFGLGVNFLATWDAWRQCTQRPGTLHMVSLERHPVDAPALRQHAPPAVRHLAQRLAERWPPATPGVHRLVFDEEGAGRVVLTLVFGDAPRTLRRLRLQADAVFLDGFAPRVNPQLWSAHFLRQVAAHARPGAAVATWCVAGEVRTALHDAGFDTERLPGFGAKRQRLAGVKRGRAPTPPMVPREIAIVGAGLAGCAAAWAFAQRGWSVQLVDGAAEPAQGTSSLPWGLLHPQVSADDNPASRLSRQGFLWWHDQLARWREQGVPLDPIWKPVGVWRQLSPTRRDPERLLAAWRHAPHWVQLRRAEDALPLVGAPAAHAGLWWPQGGMASAAGLCRHWLERCGGHLHWHGATTVQRLQAQSGGWRLFDAQGTMVLESPCVLLANAHGAGALAGVAWPQQAWRGQIGWLATAAPVRAARAGEGYLMPAAPGVVGVGSTYEAEGHWLDPQTAWAALEALWQAAWPAPAPAWVRQGRFEGVRCAMRDRLPLAGAVPAEEAGASLPGLHVLAGLGSRGLSLAGLLAEDIASHLNGEPGCLPHDLARAVDPGRFRRRDA